MQIDRVKNPAPVFVSHLSIALFGTVQPDRLEEVFRDADDGLCSRFLWTWPNPRPFRQPKREADIGAAVERLKRLAALPLDDSEGELAPRCIPLEAEGQAVLEDFAREMQARENGAAPLMKSTIGKARGQALRLAITLEFLWWAAARDPREPEPSRISTPAMEAATGLMDAYFLPQAERVFGDAAISADERNARTLAGWIIKMKPEIVNISAIRDTARLPGLREAARVKAACQFLVEASWLRPAPLAGVLGRPRGDFLVNPRLKEVPE
jgi:hypothetical protein